MPKSGIRLCSPRRPEWDRTEGGDGMSLTYLFYLFHSSPAPHSNVPEAKEQGSLNLTWCMRVCIESDLNMVWGEKYEPHLPQEFLSITPEMKAFKYTKCPGWGHIWGAQHHNWQCKCLSMSPDPWASVTVDNLNWCHCKQVRLPKYNATKNDMPQ